MRMHRRAAGAAAIWMMMTLVLTGCTSEASNIGVAKGKEENVVDTGFTVSTVGSFDSADTAVVLATDLTNKAVSLINMETGKQYTLYYDGTTYVKDKYDGPMTISQIEAGDVVDVTFLKGKKKLASIKRSPEAWVFDGVYNYDLAGPNRTASIGSQTYSLPDGVVVLSEGRRMESAEVVTQDVVTISGIDHKIYSVNVEKGHGYLRLKNDQPLLGGWIEVGNSMIRQITEDMLLTVPEGSYQVVLSNNGVGCVKEVTVERDKEVVLDVSDVEISEDKTGRILFSVTPETAKVSVDGKPVDISKAVEMRYGIHQVQVEASGYDTLTKYIQVGSEYATISFKLEETRKDSGNRNSVSDNTTERIPWQDTLSSLENKDTVSDNTLSSLSENALGTTSNNKVYIDSPKGVEVYLDGNYIGVAPVRFTKSAGRHEITLKKSGYKTKTYTIYLENNKRDETYSFSALEKEGADSGTDKKIPSDVVSAASEIADCRLKDGTDVIVAVDPNDSTHVDATLQDSGIKVIEAAVKAAVQMKIGEAEVAKYTFKVAENLEKVTAPGENDGSGTVSVTIKRDGYTEQTVSCNVVIEKKAGGSGSTGEPPLPTTSDGSTSGGSTENVVSVTVSADKNEVSENETVTFTAVVKENDIEKEDAEISWEVTELSSSATWEYENKMSLTVESGETAEQITATASYMNKEGSYSVAIKKKEPETPKDPDDSSIVDPENPSQPSTGDNSEGNESSVDGSDQNGDEGDATGNQGENGSGGSGGNNQDESTSALTTEKFTVNQEAHPIRKFFSSLFK